MSAGDSSAESGHHRDGHAEVDDVTESASVPPDDEEEGLDEEEGSESEDDNSEEDEDDSDSQASEDDDEEEGDAEEDDEEDDGMEEGTSMAQDMESDDSSSGDESDRCPICLSKFRDQDVGSPESCDHSFCLECILEWSKNVNTCPADRQVFHLILAKHSLEGTIYKRIAVHDNTQKNDEAAFDETTECEVCGNTNNEDRMLLCDSCNLGYHMYCLTPALERVPRGMWHCPVCLPATNAENGIQGAIEIESDEEEVINAPRRRWVRQDVDDGIQIGRTLIRERVLAVITRNRGGSRVIDSDSDWDMDGEEELPGTSSGSPRVKRKVTRKKTVRRKRKVTKKRKPRKSKKRTGKTSSQGQTRKTRKRKGGRRKKKTKRLARTKKLTPATPKIRIAGRLGLSSPPVGRHIPMVKCQKERSLDMLRGDVGVRALNILGEQNSMIRFSDQSDDEEMAMRQSGNTAVARPVIPRTGPRFATKAALKGCALPGFSSRAPEVAIASPQHETTCDLLGSILDNQNLLMTKCEKVKIHKDGSLTHVPPKLTSSGARSRGISSPSDGGSDTNSPQAGNEKSSESQNHADTAQTDSKDDSPTQEGSCEPTADSSHGLGDGSGSRDHGSLSMDSNKNDDLNPVQSPKPSENSDSDSEKPKSTDKLQSQPNKWTNASWSKPQDFKPLTSLYSDEELELNIEEESSSAMEITEDILKEDSDTTVKPETGIVSYEDGESDSQDEAHVGAPESTVALSSENSSATGAESDKEEKTEVASTKENTSKDTTPSTLHAMKESKNPDVSENGESEGTSSDEASDSDDSDDGKPLVTIDGLHMVPFSELPRIPKFKRKSPETIEQEQLETDTSKPHAGVLERLNMGDKKDSYPKWSKKEENSKYTDSKQESKRKSKEKDTSRPEKEDRTYKQKDKSDEEEDSGSKHKSRRRSRSRSRDRDRERSNYNQSRSHDKDRDRYRDRDRDRDRNRDRTRDRDRDRERDRHHRSRSKERYRRRSRSRDRRSDSQRRHRSSRRTRTRSRSPRRRDDSERGSERDSTRDSGRDRNRNDEEYKGTSRMFSQSLKEVSEPLESPLKTPSRAFKLKRNFLDDIKAKLESMEKRPIESHKDSSDNNKTSLYEHTPGTTDSPDAEITFVSQSEPITVIELDRDRSNDDEPDIDSDFPTNHNRPPSPREPFRKDLMRVPDDFSRPFESHRQPPEPLMGLRPPSPSISQLDIMQDEPSEKPISESVFKIPSTPPTRGWSRDDFDNSHKEDTYDPSEPTTELSISPPHMDMFLKQFGSRMNPPERLSPMQARMPFGEMMRPLRPPLLADPVPQREPPPHPHQPPPFVTMTESIRQVLPGLPAFLQHGLPRNLRPPLLMNPPLLGPHQMGRLPRLSGPQISWQAVSHPNVILHNRIPIQVSQNGMPMHPNAPEAFLHRQHLEHAASHGHVPDNLATPPPPLPPKALEEMQQISQLLNAQAQLAHFAQGKAEPMGVRDPNQSLPDLFGPPALHQMGSKQMNDVKSVTFDETMEVVDMDVASPLSDDVGMTFSPPPQDSIMENEPQYDYKRPGSNRHDHLNPDSKEDHTDEDKFLKKLNRQERVVEEVKLAIKPHYSKGKVSKAEYKEIMRKAVPKICHSKSGDINPEKIRNYVEQYVTKIRLARKYAASKKKKGSNVHNW